jgi:hypothetical protein
MAALTTPQEFLRISQILANLTVSVPIALMTASRIDEIAARSADEPTLASLNNELRKRLKAVQGPQDHTPMAQAYEAYAHAHPAGHVYFGFGNPGEQLFSLPEFDGKNNLAGHQTRNGIFREYPGLMAITFVHPRWNQKSELLTLWNVGFDQSVLKNPCGLSESDIDDLLYKFSDGVNDPSNERGWHFRIIPLRP